MIYEIVTNPIVLMVLCGFATFGLMFGAKHLYLGRTKKIKDEKIRRVVNLVLGTASSVEIALAVMWGACDLLEIDYLWNFAIASGFVATLMYLAFEKVLGAEADAAGKVILDFISHSEMFDGKLSKEGAYSFIKQMATSIAKVDDAKKQKERNAVDGVAAKLDEFLFDGKITEEEKRQAKKIVEESGIDVSAFYDKYSALLK
jgi:hypothetical protein